MTETQSLRRVLKQIGTPRVLVLGDLILDRYVDGRTERVSPEAPVLVFDFDRQRYLLGGACNVAANLAALGAVTSVLGAVGEDVSGQQLRELLQDAQIATDLLITDKDRPTTLKTRYVSQTAQVLRVDRELRHGLGGEAESRMLEILAARPVPFDAVLLSDYGKGVLTRRVIEAAVEAARDAGIPVVVDPKGTDYTRYRGVDLLTPNKNEAEAATGLTITDVASMHTVAAKLRELTGIPQATITLGKDGIFHETGDGSHRIIPTEAKSVFDVTGAGDTVVSVLAFARAAGVDLGSSLMLANVAAGITVGKFGTWAVSREELLAVLERSEQQADSHTGKVLDRNEAMAKAAELRAQGKRLVFSNGCFDILHPGHTDYLARARTYGDALVVAVNTDESVRRQDKAPGRPVNSLSDRMAVLAALQSVDFVLPFDDDTPAALIEALTPAVLVKGEDWRDKGVVGREWVENHGGQVVLVPLRKGNSTTSMVDRILSTCRPAKP